MLAVEMLFHQQRIHGQFRIDGISNACHLSYLFHYHCVVYSIMRIFSPREGAVILYQYSRCVYRVQPFKALHDYISGFHFIRIQRALRIFAKALEREQSTYLQILILAWLMNQPS